MKKKIYDINIDAKTACDILIKEIKSKYYCDDAFRLRFIDNLNKVNLSLLYCSEVDEEYEIQSISYEKEHTYSYTTGYTGELRGNTVTVRENKDYSSYTAKENDKVKISVSAHAGDHLMSYIGSGYSAHPMSDEDRKRLYECKASSTANEMQCGRNINEKINKECKQYVRSKGGKVFGTIKHNGSYLKSVCKYAPFYKFSFEGNDYYVSAVSGKVAGAFNFVKNNNYENDLQQAKEKDRKLHLGGALLVLAFCALIWGEFISLNTILFSRYNNPSYASSYALSSRSLWLGFIITGMIIFVIAEVTLLVFMCIQASKRVYENGFKLRDSSNDKVNIMELKDTKSYFLPIIIFGIIGFVVAVINCLIGVLKFMPFMPD